MRKSRDTDVTQDNQVTW